MTVSRLCSLVIVAGSLLLLTSTASDPCPAAEPNAARQLLEKFYAEHPPRPSEAVLREQERAMNSWAKQEGAKMAAQIGQDTEQLVRASPSTPRPQAMAGDLNAGNLSAQQLETLSREIAEATRKLFGSTEQQGSGGKEARPKPPSTDELPATSSGANRPKAQTGPLHFTIPDGWAIARVDPDGLLLTPKGAGPSASCFINVFRYPSYGGTYTAEAINKKVIDTSIRFPSPAGAGNYGTRVVPVGRERRMGVWTGASENSAADGPFVREHVLVEYAGGVYMISTAYGAQQKEMKQAYDQVVRSLEFGDRPAGLPESGSPTSPQDPPSRQPEASRPEPLGEADNAGKPSREEIEAIAKRLNENFARFVRSQTANEVDRRVDAAIRQGQQWIGSVEKGQDYNGFCLTFVKDAYNLPVAGLPNAEKARQHFEEKGVLHATGWDNAPQGSWFFFKYVDKKDGNVGHVAIRTGPDTVIDAMIGRKPVIAESPLSSDSWYAKQGRFQGWVSPADVIRYYNQK